MDDDYVSPSTTMTQTIGGNVNAYGVQIRFQANDLVRPTSNSVSTPIFTQSNLLSSSTAPASASTGSPSSGLSTGAKAGIGVGVTLAGLLFLLALFFGWRYITKLRNAQGTPKGRDMMHDKAETTSIHYQSSSIGPFEAQGKTKYNGPYEAAAQELRGELPEQSETRKYELHGEGR
ncbi:hypothetical protein ACLMJK_004568 [Lecanora helva]